MRGIMYAWPVYWGLVSLSGCPNESMYHIAMANSDTLFHDRQKVDGRVFRVAKLLPYEVKVI